MEEYDLIIIGSGAAGLTAAIYACRKKLKTLLLGKEVGGQTASAATIENYPGFERVRGMDLIKIFEKQARSFGAEIIHEQVIEIKKKGNFVIKSERREYSAKAIILAFGKTPRSLDVKGEKELLGRGISYCATCDGNFFTGKIVAVVGGGNSAIGAVYFLSNIAKKVYSIHRRDEFLADEVLIEKIKKLKNVESLVHYVIKEFKGKNSLTSIVISDKKGKTKELKIDGCFIEVGSEVKTDFIKKLMKLDAFGHIIVNEKCETSTPGIFAAGDVTNIPFKQTVIAAGEGAKAALSAYNYIKGIKPRFTADWIHGKED
ncbi:FAD-dependent oxidoreductase [Candidatus Pacearchaeota archaeon]|nr:FAD-dependent oxidoreductase [Candidatus Pacearchaeota archaeon]